MGLQITITPYGSGHFRLWARGFCSGLLCEESREWAENSQEMWHQCESITTRIVLDQPGLEDWGSREIIHELVHQMMAGNADLSQRIYH